MPIMASSTENTKLDVFTTSTGSGNDLVGDTSFAMSTLHQLSAVSLYDDRRWAHFETPQRTNPSQQLTPSGRHSETLQSHSVMPFSLPPIMIQAHLGQTLITANRESRVFPHIATAQSSPRSSPLLIVIFSSGPAVRERWSPPQAPHEPLDVQVSFCLFLFTGQAHLLASYTSSTH